jgi:hypothetical protein
MMSAAPSGGRSGLDRPDRPDRANDMEKAAAILAEARAAGAVLGIEGNKLKVRNSVRLPAAVRADLDVHWRAVVALFSGGHCRHCGRVIDWLHDGVAFADGTWAHIPCYENVGTTRPLPAPRSRFGGDRVEVRSGQDVVLRSTVR